MISQERIKQLLNVFLSDEAITNIIRKDKTNEAKSDLLYNAESILKESNLTDVRDEDIVGLVMQFVLSIHNAKKQTQQHIHKGYVIANTSELHTGGVFSFNGTRNIFKPAIQKCLLQNEVELQDTVDFYTELDKLPKGEQERIIKEKQDNNQALQFMKGLYNDAEERDGKDLEEIDAILKGLKGEEAIRSVVSDDFNRLIDKVKEAQEKVNTQINIDKNFYDFLIDYIYDRLPDSMRLASAEESVMQLYNITK